MYGDEIFSTEPPVPVSKRSKIPPPEDETTAEPKPKRPYTRRSAPTIEATPDPVTTELHGADDSEALLAAEGLFEDAHLLGYYTVQAFIRLFRMVKPENRPELAKIIEGLVSSPRPETGRK